MARRSETKATVDDRLLAQILAPRDGLVVERREPADGGAAGDGDGSVVFVAERGPVGHYRRTVEVRPAGSDAHEVRQVVEHELAIPFFGWLFAIPYERALARLGRPGRHPWWAPPDAIDTRAAAMLASLCALAGVAAYPGVLLTQTIEFAREELGFSEQAQSLALAVVRGDIVVALGLVTLADRRGRRSIALLSLYLGCAMTAVGALSPSVHVLTATQLVARGCITAVAILLGVMAAEEMPAGSRAYAVSLLSVSGALGVALALAVFPVADLDPRGWRIVYVIALVGIPLIAVCAKRLPESRRFTTPHRDVKLSSHGRRFWLLAASAFLFAIFWGPAAQYQNVFLRRERGFSAARISLFTVATNVWGGLGIVAGGRLADVRGRRVVAAVGIVGGVGATVLMFFSAGWPVWAWSVVGSIVGAATVPALSVYGPELFPTSLRGRANGVISALGRIGSVLGLLVLALIVGRQSELAPIMALLALGPALVVVLVLVAYPETAHRELEDLNPEDRPPPEVAH
ncbi:MAG TPA: MFS transporter [Acidimicrobiales bacterium]|nr:MFS transporter [Acidimicrobiales bacterium]